ncbi:Uncharacterised protein [BD1-7 clade bacterium]|uniref:Methyltransferase FkbM domain-containing protein n=1 Tax=BD1-7 clade bacterium TaxID=2029982 RepID=A0A5S9QZA7_9GAMM|nr:Uncharacterised protein [BD1-7 clade bacterium]
MSQPDPKNAALYPLRIDNFEHAAGLYVHESGDQHVSLSIAEEAVWEAYETQLLLKILKPGSVLVDAGANIGYYSVVGGKQVGEAGQVFAFEPEPDNFALLARNVEANDLPHVRVINAGLSLEAGDARIYLSDDNFGDHQIYDDGTERPFKTIDLVAGSEYLAPFTGRIDVLKVDTQGAEFQVLSGLDELIRSSLPEFSMIIEFWPNGLKRSGSSAHVLLDLLLSYELPLHIIDHIEHRLIPCKESDLRPWIDEVDAAGTNEGFMNLYLGNLV